MRSDDDDDERCITILTGARRPDRQAEGRQQRKRQNKDRVSHDRYVKEGPSLQDKISANPSLMDAKLADYELILPEEYPKMENGTYIRYVKTERNGKRKLCLGGVLIKNNYPDYWVLKSKGGRRSVTWSVQLKPTRGCPANEYYRRKGVLYAKEDKIKYGAQVFDQVTSGKYCLVRTDYLANIAGHSIPQVLKPPKQESRSGGGRTKLIMESDHSEDVESEDEPQPRPRWRPRLLGDEN